ncbi:hypothetical protein GF413_03270 [Candidatus Micrarchaeota archaeon]|nr:hypothetical protein [Candidatus Micrarchaeota archaeon]
MRMDLENPATVAHVPQRNPLAFSPESAEDQGCSQPVETSSVNRLAFHPSIKRRQANDIRAMATGVLAIVAFLGILIGLEWADLREDWRHIFHCFELQMAFMLIAIYGYVYWRQRTRGSRIAASFEKAKDKIDKSQNKVLNKLYREHQKGLVRDMSRCVMYELDKYSYEITPRLYDKYDDWISKLVSDGNFYVLYDMWEMFQNTNVRHVANNMVDFSQKGGRNDRF